MVDTFRELSEIFNTFPDYIGQGIVELLIMVVGGLLLGYVTSKYLYRINELNKVEGWLLEKRIPIYEGLFHRTEKMMELYMISPSLAASILEVMGKHGLELNEESKQVSQMFMDPDKMTEFFLEFDEYVTKNRLFFDEEVSNEIIVLQNYLGLLRRLLVLYDEQMIDYKIHDKEDVKKVRAEMMIALGMYLSDEFLQYVMSAQNTIRVSLNHLEFSHRKKPDYSYDYYQNEQGFLMTRMMDSKAIKDREAIRAVITEYTARGFWMGGM